MRAATRRRRNRGYILVMVAICSTFMLGLLGLAIDVGYMEYQRSMMQTAADSAAAAAAIEAGLGSSSSTVSSAGQHGASLNGFTANYNNVSVAINNPPTVGQFTGNNNYYEAIVQQPIGTFFMRMMNFSTLNATARGVAGLKNPPWVAQYCAFVMNTGAKSGAATISGYWNSQCGIHVNSTSSSAISIQHNCSGSSFRTCGGISGASYITSGATSTYQSQVGDPYSNMQPPSYAGTCDHDWYETNWSGSTTLDPGVYCGGIWIHGSCNVTFNPGTYVIKGGGLYTDGNASGSLTGSGCHFYNTYDNNTCNWQSWWEGCYSPVWISTNGTCNLSAPTSGAQEGILFHDDRTSDTSGWNYYASLDGATGSTFKGACYMPNKNLTYNGTSGSDYTVLVSDTLTIPSWSQQPSGSYPTCGNNYSTCTHGNPTSRQNSCQLAE